MSKVSVLFPEAIRKAKEICLRLEEKRVIKPYPSVVPVFSGENSNYNLIAAFEECITGGKPITAVSPKVKMHYAASMEHYRDRIEINFNQCHNLCWARYYVSKELAHLIGYDSVKDHELCTATSEDVRKLIDDLLAPHDIVNHMEQSLADQLAYFTAIELLVPSSWVPQLLKVRERIADEGGVFAGKENVEIAKALRVPEKVIEARLDNPIVQAFFK